MSIVITDINDLPCKDWEGTPAEVKDCPMEKWCEGEQKLCLECGHTILFDEETPTKKND